ncbi:hypothetical protein Tco_1390102, partial [Tanacetum coccineum]
MQTKTELTLEQTQQGVSDEVLVSIEGVEELKRNVKIKGEKKEALLTLRQKPGLDIAHAVGVMSRYMVEPDLTVKGYVDSDYAGDLDGKYVATAQANKESVWLKMLLEDLRTKQEKITPFCDNYSALYLARNPT